MNIRVLALTLAVALVAGTAMATSAQQRPPVETEVVSITNDAHPPVFTKTPEEEFERLSETDAIAVVEVLSLPGIEKTPVIKVRGIVKDGVKASSRAALWAADGTIEFEFDGPDEYPILKNGERYLVFFQLHPFMTRWYPALPFRVDEAGRLEQVEFVSSQDDGWKSPINGLPLTEAVERLRKK